MNLTDELKSLQKRESFSAGFAKEKFAEPRQAMLEKEKAFYTQYGQEKAAGPLKELDTVYDAALGKLKEKATLTDKGWVPNTKDDKEFKNVMGAYDNACAELENFLSGKTKVENVGVADALKKSYEEAKLASGKVASVLNHPFGFVKVDGWAAAAKNTVAQVTMKEGRKFPFAKSVVAAGGAAIMADSLRSKKSDGEDRSPLTRLTEVVVGGAVMGGAVVAGRAL